MNALKVGIDTVKITATFPVDVTVFERVHESGNGVKSFVKLTRNHDDIRATYYPNQERVVIEASLPKLLHGDNWDLVTDAELPSALARLVGWLGDCPDVGQWKVLRVDYAADWQIERGVQSYLDALSKASLNGYDKTLFKNGVSWRNQSRVIRWYNKTVEQGYCHRLDVRLRLEVSTLPSGVWYIARSRGWESNVQSLVSDGVSRSVLSHWLTKLGVCEGWGSTDDIRSRVYSLFGRRAAGALEHLYLIQTHGSDAVALGLTSKASYYRYKDELSRAGLLGSVVGLDVLTV